MALSFPLATSGLAELLKVQSATFRVADFVQVSGVAIGDIITSRFAWPKWVASVQLVPMEVTEARKIHAILDAVGLTNQFFLYDTEAPYPADDPAGLGLAGAAPKISSFGSSTLRIKDLPAGYQLRAGDMVGFSYGADPVRYALHRLCQDTQASGGGLAASVTVVPPVRGAEADLAVTLIRPAIKMKLLPGSFEPGASEGTVEFKLRSGMKFDAIEDR